MKRMIVSTLLLVAMPSAFAASSLGGFVSGGVSRGSINIEDDAGNSFDIDQGNGFNITGGIRFNPRMMLRASYDSTNHDSGSGCISGAGCGTFSGVDLDINETRVGFFYAPPQNRVVGFLVGGGYEKIALKDNQGGSDAKSDGPFVEGALLLNAGPVATFTIGAAGFALKDDGDENVTGAEGKLGVAFHLGPVDLGVMGRRILLKTDLNNGGSEDDTYTEVQLTVGAAWGYPN